MFGIHNFNDQVFGLFQRVQLHLRKRVGVVSCIRWFARVRTCGSCILLHQWEDIVTVANVVCALVALELSAIPGWKDLTVSRLCAFLIEWRMIVALLAISNATMTVVTSGSLHGSIRPFFPPGHCPSDEVSGYHCACYTQSTQSWNS